MNGVHFHFKKCFLCGQNLLSEQDIQYLVCKCLDCPFIWHWQAWFLEEIQIHTLCSNLYFNIVLMLHLSIKEDVNYYLQHNTVELSSNTDMLHLALNVSHCSCIKVCILHFCLFRLVSLPLSLLLLSSFSSSPPLPLCFLNFFILSCFHTEEWSRGVRVHWLSLSRSSLCRRRWGLRWSTQGHVKR